MIKAAIFDMDGLLINSEPVWEEAARIVMKKADFDVTPEIHQNTTGLSVNLFLDYCYDLQPWTNIKKEDLANEILQIAHEWIPEKSEAMPGAKVLIQWLSENNIRMAVASASPMEIIESVLRKLDIISYFECWHSAELEAFSKPHPAVYSSTIKKLNLLPEECLAFEDSVPGVQSAYAAGALTIAVPSAFGFQDKRFDSAHYKIPSLENFQSLNLL
jgi:HAD superfamily hydrolase (TIGR01509 family)